MVGEVALRALLGDAIPLPASGDKFVLHPMSKRGTKIVEGIFIERRVDRN